MVLDRLPIWQPSHKLLLWTTIAVVTKYEISLLQFGINFWINLWALCRFTQSSNVFVICCLKSSLIYWYIIYSLSDIDDCRNNSCQSNSTCVDKLNGYECDCPAGLKGIYCQSSKCWVINIKTYNFYDNMYQHIHWANCYNLAIWKNAVK